MRTHRRREEIVKHDPLKETTEEKKMGENQSRSNDQMIKFFVETFKGPHRGRRTKNGGKMEAKGLKGKSNEQRLNNERRKENGPNLQHRNWLQENDLY